MYMTERVKTALPAVIDWIMQFPKDLCVTLDEGYPGCSALRVSIQAWTQETAANARAMAGRRLIWKKSYLKDQNWWEYDASSSTLDCDIHIYAVREAPPTCRVERKTIEVEEDFPVAFEKRMVQREVVEVHCGD